MIVKFKGTEPFYANEYAAGADLYISEDITINAKDVVTVGTGTMVEIPQNYFGAVVIRSGMAFKKNLMLTNGVGIIDPDYRGEIKLRLFNAGNETVTLEKGTRVAQLILIPRVQAQFIMRDLSVTERGNKGFDSTGIK